MTNKRAYKLSNKVKYVSSNFIPKDLCHILTPNRKYKVINIDYDLQGIARGCYIEHDRGREIFILLNDNCAFLDDVNKWEQWATLKRRVVDE